MQHTRSPNQFLSPNPQKILASQWSPGPNPVLDIGGFDFFPRHSPAPIAPPLEYGETIDPRMMTMDVYRSAAASTPPRHVQQSPTQVRHDMQDYAAFMNSKHGGRKPNRDTTSRYSLQAASVMTPASKPVSKPSRTVDQSGEHPVARISSKAPSVIVIEANSRSATPMEGIESHPQWAHHSAFEGFPNPDKKLVEKSTATRERIAKEIFRDAIRIEKKPGDPDLLWSILSYEEKEEWFKLEHMEKTRFERTRRAERRERRG